MSIDVQLLREALRLQPAEDDEPENDLVIEKMGDDAFDWILGELRAGALTPHERIRGLRLLARITRQFCVGRKGELLDFALTLAQSSSTDRDVRSAAVHIAIMGARIARGLRDANMAYGRSLQDIYVEVSSAVRQAVEVGLTPEIEAFAKEFLSTSTTAP